MRKREQIRFWVYAVGEVITAVWTVTSLWLDLQGFGTKYDFRLLALIGFLVFVALVMLHLRQQYSIILGETPSVSIYDMPILISDEFGSTIRDGKGREKNLVVDVLIVQAKFANNPKARTTNNTARNVTARITYYDEQNNKIIGPTYGHWSDTGYPNRIEINEFLSTDFLSNGLPKSLDLAVKCSDSNNFYAFNHEDYAYDFYFGWRDENFKLGENNIFIQVQLIGEMVEEEFWFKLSKKGRKKEFEVVKLNRKAR